MPAPAELGIPYFLILSAVCALLINANHERLSSIFTKIGPVEFREMLEEQTEEANEVILGIEERFEYIEHTLKENDDPAGWQHMFSHDRISKLIINYLDFSNTPNLFQDHCPHLNLLIHHASCTFHFHHSHKSNISFDNHHLDQKGHQHSIIQKEHQ